MAYGYLSLVLHTHLPFVRHLEADNKLEEDWLFEAITEVYLPLLLIFEKLTADKINIGITVTLSPTLIAMLQDKLLIERYLQWLDKLILLTEQELDRTAPNCKLNKIAKSYYDRYTLAKGLFDDDQMLDIVGWFKKFMMAGEIEIIATAATHGYLPLLSVDDKGAKVQINLGLDCYESTFGCSSPGFWFPESGYQPGYETILADRGVKYFIVDTHGTLRGNPIPNYGVYFPCQTEARVAFFGRDLESSYEVWSSKAGYPANPLYRDFYSDIGYQLDLDYLKSSLGSDFYPKPVGIKYHSIAQSGDTKEIYDQSKALEQVKIDAENFVQKRIARLMAVEPLIREKPVIVACYDTELFGHWWHEGGLFLDLVLRNIDESRDKIRIKSLSNYLEKSSNLQLSTPSASSWGEGGYSMVWLNQKNDFIYRPLLDGLDEMMKLAKLYHDANNKVAIRALNQAARELLLAQSSDWPFIMTQETFKDYAQLRFNGHIENFNKLAKQIRAGSIQDHYLARLELQNNIFPDISYRIFNEY